MPMTVSHAKSSPQGDFTGTATVYNSAGATTTVLATDLVRPSDWNSSNHVYTLALGSNELTNALAIGAAFFEPFPIENSGSTLSAPGIGTWYIDGPYAIDDGIGMGQVNMLVSNAAGFLGGDVYSAASTGSVSKYQTFYNYLAVYKQGAGASSSRLESVWTGCASILATWSIRVTSSGASNIDITNALSLSFPSQFDVTGGATYGSTSQSASTRTTTASTWASSIANSLITGAVAYVSGARMDMIAMASFLTPGVYWLAHMFTSSSSTTGTRYGGGTMMSTHSRLGMIELAMNAYKRPGRSISDSSSNVQPFHGYLATTTSGASSIINMADVRGTTGRMYWNYAETTQ